MAQKTDTSTHRFVPLAWCARLRDAGRLCAQCGTYIGLERGASKISTTSTCECGVAFCSDTCKNHARSHHRSVCVGADDVNLVRLKSFAVEFADDWGLLDGDDGDLPLYEIFHIALCILGRSVSGTDSNTFGGSIFGEDPKNRSRVLSSYFEDSEFVDALQSFVAQSFSYLPITWQTCKLIGGVERMWDALLAHVAANIVDVHVEDPWALDSSGAVSDVDTARKRRRDVFAAKHAGAASSIAHMSDDQIMRNIDDKRTRIFPPLTRFVLYDCALVQGGLLRHSCLGSQLSNAASCRFDARDDSLTILESPVQCSLICSDVLEMDQSYAFRRSLLARRFSDRPCACERCVFEATLFSQDPQDGSQTMLTLETILARARQEDRHHDALDIVTALLSRTKGPARRAELLFDRARLEGFCGNFTKREITLRESFREIRKEGVDEKTCTRFQDISDAVEEMDSYYRRSADASVAPAAVDIPFREIMETDEEEEEGSNCIYAAPEVLPRAECAEMCAMAEAYSNWSTDRHYAVPTADFPLWKHKGKKGGILEWFNHQLEHRIYPLLRRQFSIAKTKRLRVLDAFFVKYDSDGGQCRLPLHQDESEYSLTIAMNSLKAYEGGGTYFLGVDSVEKTDSGGIVSFTGSSEHSGEKITKGIRYIIVVFLYTEVHGSSEGEGTKEKLFREII